MLIACNATLSAQKTEPVSGEECRLKGYIISWICNDGEYEQDFFPQCLHLFFAEKESFVFVCKEYYVTFFIYMKKVYQNIHHMLTYILIHLLSLFHGVLYAFYFLF